MKEVKILTSANFDPKCVEVVKGAVRTKLDGSYDNLLTRNSANGKTFIQLNPRTVAREVVKTEAFRNYSNPSKDKSDPIQALNSFEAYVKGMSWQDIPYNIDTNAQPKNGYVVIWCDNQYSVIHVPNDPQQWFTGIVYCKQDGRVIKIPMKFRILGNQFTFQFINFNPVTASLVTKVGFNGEI